MPGDLGSYLFTFAVISDSHVNPEEDRSASPYAVNNLANGRFRYVVDDLDRRQLAFTVHLGDMGNPLPELTTYRRAAERFQTIAGDLRSPLHLVAGNHCVGDKPGGWVPVPRVSTESLAQYQEVYGRQFYSFDQGPCHFVILSSLLVNSGLAAEAEQRSWAESDLAVADEAGKRIWVMMHYPAYIGAPDELGSYDNVDQPGRSWLLRLFEKHDVEAVYSGHVHNYFYNRYAGTDLYTVPATSFVRQDYSELFQVAPEDEQGGRDDAAKLGYCLVAVHEKGHRNQVVRTYGRRLAEATVLEARGHATPDAPRSVMLPRQPTRAAPVGVEMRENWLSRVALRTNNSVSPFTRRCARNDWPILALDEMGVSKVRVSLQELVKEDVVERIAALQESGFDFTVYSHGIPREAEYRLIREHRALLGGWELIARLDQIHVIARRLADRGLSCYLNEVRDISQGQLADANVKHEANYGFQLNEKEKLEQLCRRDEVRQAFKGLVFRIRRRGQPEVAPWSAIREISAMGREWGMRHQAHILFSGNLTADRLEDDAGTANRVAEATLAAWVAGNVDVTFDTFEDVDRGYFVRHGLVDRRYNPRLAAKVLRHLQAALARHEAADVRECSVANQADGRLLSVRFAKRLLVLALPDKGMTLHEIDAEIDGAKGLSLLDLGDGTAAEVPVTSAGAQLRLDETLLVEQPLLLTIRPDPAGL